MSIIRHHTVEQFRLQTLIRLDTARDTYKNEVETETFNYKWMYTVCQMHKWMVSGKMHKWMEF